MTVTDADPMEAIELGIIDDVEIRDGSQFVAITSRAVMGIDLRQCWVSQCFSKVEADDVLGLCDHHIEQFKEERYD